MIPTDPRRKLALAAGVVLVTALAVAGAWLLQGPAPAPQGADAPGRPSAATPAQTDRPQLVVLPFANTSGDFGQDYFGDGIAEDLTTALSRIPGFLVIARSSAFAYKGRKASLAQIGRELGVRYALEGGAQMQGDRLRLTAQLMDTQTGAQLWAATFDRPLADIFIVQDELGDKILGSVAPSLASREGEPALAASPARLEAYDLTMRARQVVARAADRDATFAARRGLELAIERDPGYALAYSYLAIALDRFRVNRWNDEYGTPVITEKALAAAAKAVSLAPKDATAHAMQGRLLTANGQFNAAIAAAEAALALGPNDADTITAAATIMRRSARFAETVELIRRAMKLDPFIDPQAVGSSMGLALYRLGRFTEAEEAARFCIARAPGAQPCRQTLVAALAQGGHEKEAQAAAAELLRVAPGFTVGALVRQMLPANRNPADVESFAAGLRKAGLPE